MPVMRRCVVLASLHASADPACAAQAGRYGCLAARNVYNCYNTTDPVAYQLNAAVSPQARLVAAFSSSDLPLAGRPRVCNPHASGLNPRSHRDAATRACPATSERLEALRCRASLCLEAAGLHVRSRAAVPHGSSCGHQAAVGQDEGELDGVRREGAQAQAQAQGKGKAAPRRARQLRQACTAARQAACRS